MEKIEIIGENTMENDFGTQDIITGRGLNVGGFGYGQGAGYGQFASPSANAIRVNRNEGVIRDTSKCTQDTLSANLDRISAQNFEGRFNSAITSLRDSQFQGELRTSDKLCAITAQINADARAAAECCCAVKLQACEDKSQILAAIAASNATALAVESRNVERSLNASNAELTALKVQVACGCCPPHPS